MHFMAQYIRANTDTHTCMHMCMCVCMYVYVVSPSVGKGKMYICNTLAIVYCRKKHVDVGIYIDMC